jgi:hypothetical protein
MNLARHEIDLRLDRLRRTASRFSIGSTVFLAAYLVVTTAWRHLFLQHIAWFDAVLLVGAVIPTAWSYHLQGIMRGLREATALLDPPSAKGDDDA